MHKEEQESCAVDFTVTPTNLDVDLEDAIVRCSSCKTLTGSVLQSRCMAFPNIRARIYISSMCRIAVGSILNPSCTDTVKKIALYKNKVCDSISQYKVGIEAS